MRDKNKLQNNITHNIHFILLHLMFTKVEEIPLLTDCIGKIGSK